MLAISQDKTVFLGVRYTARSYIEIVRNTPFIVQLFFVAFGLPLLFDYQWSFFASALLAITLNFSAYFAEIVRSGIDTIDKGQLEAAKSLCFSKRQTLIDIILPQALVKVYPSLTSQFVFLFLILYSIMVNLYCRFLLEAVIHVFYEENDIKKNTTLF